jgi:type 1 fimbria pilin
LEILMKLNFKKGLVASATLAATSLMTASAHAGTSAELKITGKITPPSCELSLGGNGVVDFGSTAFNALNVDGTRLASKTVQLNVTCEGATRVALSVLDNRASSKVSKASLNIAAWASAVASINDDFIFGLGTAIDADQKPAKIGGVMFGFKEGKTTVDGNFNPNVIYSSDKATWSFDPTIRQYMSPTLTYSFVNGIAGSVGNTTPAPLRTVSADLLVTPTINRSGELPTTDVIDLDGSATISLVYL